MAVILHYANGTSITLPSAVSTNPWPSDNDFVQVIGISTNPANVGGLVPACNLLLAEIQ